MTINIKNTKNYLMDKDFAEKIAQEVLVKMEENPGMTLRDATGISEDSLEEIYSLAYTFYHQGKYREAIALFEFLTGAAPQTYPFVLGLAASYHQLQAYEEASVGFYIALNIAPDNPVAAYYITDCFLKQKLYEEAQEFAEITSFICDTHPEYAELKQRCSLIIDALANKDGKDSLN